jgi:hypothetical protein
MAGVSRRVSAPSPFSDEIAGLADAIEAADAYWPDDLVVQVDGTNKCHKP